MKNKKAKKIGAMTSMYISLPFMAIVMAVIIALLCLSVQYKETISRFLYGVGGSASAETVAGGLELCENIVDEGTVLLKNDNGALPMKDLKKVNVFGWAAYDWLTGGFGSSFSNTDIERIKLFPALEKAGIEYNADLRDMYKAFYSNPAKDYGGPWDEFRGDVSVSGNGKFTLHEPGTAYYTEDIKRSITDFSDVALVVIGRVGGEGKDLRKYQEKQVQKNGSNSIVKDESRHYLELSTEEEEMLAVAKSTCDKVIVVLNTSNTMELGFVADEQIDACLLVGLTGLNGVNSVISILKGDVNPSGRTVDIYAKDLSRTPSFATAGFGNGTDGPLKYTESTVSYGAKGYYDAYVDYSDSVYVGYRYYETFASTVTTNASAIEKIYNAFVSYPFGYGLSYTDFEWTVTEISAPEGSDLGANDEIAITVDVKNVGEVAGKDVVQLYYTAPYYAGGIEKPFVVLAAFAKTPIIEPKASASVTLTVKVRDMASYDCYGLNNTAADTHTGYELDKGKYLLKLMENSHVSKRDIGDKSITGATIEYNIPETINYDVDSKTGEPVVNRFTGNTAAEGMPIDGSRESVPVTYLSRANNMVSTLPKAQPRRSRNAAAYNLAKQQEPTNEQLAAIGLDSIPVPETGAEGTLKFTDMLDAKYSDERWRDLIEQIEYPELCNLMRNGYFKTAAIPSIEKPEFADLDGISGLNTRIFSNTKSHYVLYPNETLIAQTWNTFLAYQLGLSVGQEAKDSDISGWYAPGGNIHRSPFGGRNFEYFSEDPLLAGKFTAETVRGAKDMGLYAYIKHFAINESETMREGLFTWLTEQSLREIYLKPFEIAVKEGGANALMTSMNRIGAVWVGSSRALCTDIVRKEWGFNGSLVTDWLDSGKDYMPVFKGIYAGNSIWLNNADNNKIFQDSKYANNAAFISLAQNAAKDVLFTYVDSEQAARAYAAEHSPDSEVKDENTLDTGTKYNYNWAWGIAALELVLISGLAVWAVFIARAVMKEKKNLNISGADNNA